MLYIYGLYIDEFVADTITLTEISVTYLFYQQTMKNESMHSKF